MGLQCSMFIENQRICTCTLFWYTNIEIDVVVFHVLHIHMSSDMFIAGTHNIQHYVMDIRRFNVLKDYHFA